MSGVSGGSVGLFHLAASGFQAAQAFENASAPTIDDVAWGLMVPDIGRIFNPWVRNPVVDRGWALENASEFRAGFSERYRKGGSPLYLDSPEIRPNGERPALILNATMMERGGPLAFSNTEFLARRPAGQPVCGPIRAGEGIQDFDFLYQRQIRLVTAARLSASFPYVAPAARTFQKEPACGDYHLLDGGYFDNYGIYSLIQWLDKGLDRARPQFDSILLVRLNAFPRPDNNPTTSGWGSQLVDPLTGVLNARDTAQGMAVEELLRLVEQGLPLIPPATASALATPMKLQIADFRFDLHDIDLCKRPPLNWTLTRAQKACFAQAWNTADVQKGARTVEEYLGVAK